MAKIRTYVSVVNAIFSQLADGKNWVVDLLWWPLDSRHCWWNMLLPSGKFQSNHQINWNSLILRWRRHEECPVTVSNVFQCWAFSIGFVSVFYRLLQWTEVKYIFPRNFLFSAVGTTINSLGYLSSLKTGTKPKVSWIKKNETNWQLCTGLWGSRLVSGNWVFHLF